MCVVRVGVCVDECGCVWVWMNVGMCVDECGCVACFLTLQFCQSSGTFVRCVHTGPPRSVQTEDCSFCKLNNVLYSTGRCNHLQMLTYLCGLLGILRSLVVI